MMIPLLGVTWLFGILSPLHKAFVYIFTIFNSTQVSMDGQCIFLSVLSEALWPKSGVSELDSGANGQVRVQVLSYSSSSPSLRYQKEE